VPVGTADKVPRVIAKHATQPFSVASNPEFLKEGDAVADFMKPDRVVLGVSDDKARDVLRSLYAPFVMISDRILVMDPRSAELTKYAANAMLAVRISFMNDLAHPRREGRRRHRPRAPRGRQRRAHRQQVPVPGAGVRRLVFPEGHLRAAPHG
jgi:UDP-glucose 6-dehydrogenase